MFFQGKHFACQPPAAAIKMIASSILTAAHRIGRDCNLQREYCRMHGSLIRRPFHHLDCRLERRMPAHFTVAGQDCIAQRSRLKSVRTCLQFCND